MQFFIIPILFAALLISCAGKAPQLETQTPIETTNVTNNATVDTVKITDSIFVKEIQSFSSLQKSIDSLIALRQTEKAIELLKQQVQYYNNLDQLGFRTLQLTNLLYQTGRSAEALAILESFAVYKPAINFWIDSANVFYDKIISSNKNETVVKIDSAKIEAINSLTAQIRNLKNVNANPALITDLADSLRSLSPGDSILIWLNIQVPPDAGNSDSFCEEQRKVAAEKFALSRKNKARANILLGEAIEALNKCLEKTPTENMKKKVMQNKDILEKEKQKISN